MSTNLRKCEYCGAMIPSESKTCPVCNADLTEDATHGNIILKVIAFLVPLIGVFLWICTKRENDRQSYLIPSALGTIIWCFIIYTLC